MDYRAIEGMKFFVSGVFFTLAIGVFLFSASAVLAAKCGEAGEAACPASASNGSAGGTPNTPSEGSQSVNQKDTKIFLREPLPGQGGENGEINVSVQKGSLAILAEWVGHIYRFVAAISVIIAILVFMFAGFQMMFSGGDAGAKETAKEMILKVMMGIALLFLSGLILNFVNPKFYIFGGQSVSQDQLEVNGAESQNNQVFPGEEDYIQQEKQNYGSKWDANLESTKRAAYQQSHQHLKPIPKPVLDK